MAFSLDRKRIVVSGAARGIGSEIVVSLLSEGAFPICIDKEPYEDSELQEYLKTMRLAKPTYIQGDAGDAPHMKSVFENLGCIHGLVNNAGLLGGDNTHGGRSLESLQKMLGAHVHTALVLTELAVGNMNFGSIVNIGSIELIAAAPEVVLYTTAKGALWAMTVSYSTTLAPKLIRVNMVSPGDVSTRTNVAQYEKNEATRSYMKHFHGRTPLEQRSVTPSEVADSVLFFLSERSRAITGQQLVVDLGHTRALVDPSWLGDTKPSELYQ